MKLQISVGGLATMWGEAPSEDLEIAVDDVPFSYDHESQSFIPLEVASVETDEQQSEPQGEDQVEVAAGDGYMRFGTDAENYLRISVPGVSAGLEGLPPPEDTADAAAESSEEPEETQATEVVSDGHRRLYFDGENYMRYSMAA